MVRIKKSKLRLNLKHLSKEEKILFARQVASSLTGNFHFPLPEALLDELTKTIHLAEAVFMEGFDVRRTEVKDNEAEQIIARLETLLTRLADTVYKTARGNEEKIRSASLWLKANGSPESIPAAPQNLMVASVNDSEIAITWNAVKRARGYVVQHTTDLRGMNNWDLTLVSNKSKAQIRSLQSGTKYWFRVAAIGATGQGPWSAPATKYAL